MHNRGSKPIKAISIQSEKADENCRRISQYVGDRLGIAIAFVDDLPWQEREHLLDTGQAQLGWICGLPYVKKLAQRPASLELVAAPVMQLPRYQQQPVYFSDVIVRRESTFHSFADLRGASWAFNEPHSQSGYNITHYHLAQMGEYGGFFGRVVEAGSHLRSIDMVVAHEVEAAAIDSTVLDAELQLRPELEHDLRIIEALGPSPIPPWVVSTTLPPAIRQAICQLFWNMHETEEGRAVLQHGQIAKMVPVEDRDYDPIRDMARVAAEVRW